MSRWHRYNPELYDAGVEPYEEMAAAADQRRKERLERHDPLDPQGPRLIEYRPGCPDCGEPRCPGGDECPANR